MIPLFIRLGVGKSSFVRKLAQIDWVGSIIFIASTTGFLIPLSWGGVSYPWSSWHTVAPLSASSVGLVLLYLYEERAATNPIIRTSIFKNRNAAAAYFCVVIHGMVVVGSLYYLPLYYEAVKGLSPILSGVALFPETFTVAPGAFIVGTAISRTGHYRWAIWSGWAITTLGLGFLYFLDVDTSTVEWIFLNLVVGVGLGFNYSALGVALQASTSEEDMSSAVAMFTFFRLFGQALGVVIGGVVFQNQIKSKLLASPDLAVMADEYASDGSALAQLIINLPASSSKTTLVQAYADSLKVFWVVLCAIAGVALLVSFVLTRVSLDREFISPQALGGDRDDVRLMAERGEEESESETDQQEVIEEKPDEPPSYDAEMEPVGRRVSFREPDKSSIRPDRALSPRWQSMSGVAEGRRSSSAYSVPIDAPGKPEPARTKGIGEAKDLPPEMGHPSSWMQLSNIRQHTPLSELMADPFDNVMRRGVVRNSAYRSSPLAAGQGSNRNSGMGQSSKRNSGLGSRRQSRGEGSSRPVSWAPVYGMG